LYGFWDGQTGLNAPLYGKQARTDYPTIHNVDFAVNYWLDGGLKSEKINLGLALYGHSFTLADSSDTEVGAPVVGPGKSGKVH
jgi:chitinase